MEQLHVTVTGGQSIFTRRPISETQLEHTENNSVFVPQTTDAVKKKRVGQTEKKTADETDGITAL